MAWNSFNATMEDVFSYAGNVTVRMTVLMDLMRPSVTSQLVIQLRSSDVIVGCVLTRGGCVMVSWTVTMGRMRRLVLSIG